MVAEGDAVIEYRFVGNLCDQPVCPSPLAGSFCSVMYVAIFRSASSPSCMRVNVGYCMCIFREFLMLPLLRFRCVYSRMRHIVTPLSTIMRRSLSSYAFDTLSVTSPSKFVAQVSLNRPDKRNAINKQVLDDIRACFDQLNDDPEVRSVVLTGEGKMFCSGIDLKYLMAMGPVIADPDLDVSRKGKAIEQTIRHFQEALWSINKCTKPVIAAIHNYCIGAGSSLIAFTDVRYCTNDAVFQIKEVQLGLAPDVGAPQILGKLVGNDSLLRELILTGRMFSAQEAKELGLISRVFDTQSSLVEAATGLAAEVASFSPVAVQGAKRHLNYARDHSVQEALEFIRAWNMYNLQSSDVMESAMSVMSKGEKPPDFSKL